MNEHTIAMKTGSGHTVIDRREIVALSLAEEISGYRDTLEIHMSTGTIFCTKTTSAIESLWFESSWGGDHREEE